jgi:methyltransferase (TIGR00027 family)
VEADQSSRTAERVAVQRAVHQLLDAPKVFDDPLALRIIDADTARRIRDSPRDFNGIHDRFLRSFVSMRSRFAEDALREAYARGVRQYVLVGAGFDTFAYRNPWPDLRVWEIDHPATQTVKTRRLEDARIAAPPTLTFVAADLSQVALREVLARQRFAFEAPAFFGWLGVMMYLDLEDVRSTLRFIASMPVGSGVAFDYAIPPDALGFVRRIVYKRVLRRVASIGEPFKTFWQRPIAEDELRAAGFTGVTDLGPDEINARYLSGRSDGLRVGPSGHLVVARV